MGFLHRIILREQVKEGLLFCFLLILMFACKATALNQPFYWDEASAYIVPSHWLSQASLLRVLPGRCPAGMFFGHPPLSYLLFALQFKLFGDTLWVPHSLALLLAFVAVWYTYLLGKTLCDRTTGITAALLLFFMPLFFAQSVMFLGEIPMIALGLMAIYYVFKGRYYAYCPAAMLLLLTKETAVAIVVAIVLYAAGNEYLRNRNWRDTTHTAIRYAAPLVVFILFFGAVRITTGKFVNNPYFASESLLTFNPRSLSSWRHDLTANIAQVLKTMLLSQRMYLLTGVILLAMAVKKKRFWKREFALLLLITAFFGGAFSLIFFMKRYLTIAFVFTCLLAAWSIRLLTKGNKAAQWVLSALLMLGFITHYYPKEEYSNGETNMRYQQVIAVYKAACVDIETHYPHARIMAGWPATSYLTAPYLGYVTRSGLQVISSAASKTSGSSDDTVGPDDLVVWSGTGDKTSNDSVRQFARNHHFKLVRHYEQNGFMVEIYTP